MWSFQRSGRSGSGRALAAAVLVLASIAALMLLAIRADLAPDWLNQRLTTKSRLHDARSWTYVLHHVDIDRLSAEAGDVLVVDHAHEGGRIPFTPDEIARLKTGPGGRQRIVLAYLSIGEAEDWRYYFREDWKQNPATFPPWLIKRNCAWPGAIAVRFWMDEWRSIIFAPGDSFLRRIVSAGFDGVYLDRVDMYSAYPAIPKERPTARADMIKLVGEISATAKSMQPGFLVVPQNAEELLTDTAYRNSIDALGKEELLFSEASAATGQRNTPEKIQQALGYIGLLQRDGKPVFSIEYLQQLEEIEATRRELLSLSIVSTFPTRALDGKDPDAPIDLKLSPGTPEYIAENCKNSDWW